MERLVYLNKKASKSKFRAYGKSVSPFNVANLGRCLGGWWGESKFSADFGAKKEVYGVRGMAGFR